MSAPQTLIQAALLRLGARLGSGLMDAAVGLSALAQDVPGRVREELTLFWEEVEAEAARLEDAAPPEDVAEDVASAEHSSQDPQKQIDELRARINLLSQRLDRL
ncbi:MAG: hypothetical protein VKK98_08865 [Cyanobacteriota bacterium]|nr:hypothetical protein [Cyanobacteriota bacterium]